jgi:Peptidase A4 family
MKSQTSKTMSAIINRIAFASFIALFLLNGLVSARSAQVVPSGSLVDQTKSASASDVVPGHAPMRLYGFRPDNGIETNNWAGYAVTGNGFTDVKGSWHVPEVNCNVTPNSQSAFWAGIDGFSNGTVEQTGTSSNCNGTTPQYFAWYEFFPGGYVELTNFLVVPGDVIGAEVKYLGGETFQVRIHNHRTNQLYVHNQNVGGAERTSAEWIAEAPSTGSSCGDILPLADFHVASYGLDYTSDSGTNTAIDSVTSGRISAFGSNVQEITMVSCSGVNEAVPTSLTSDGTSFRVWWKSE